MSSLIYWSRQNTSDVVTSGQTGSCRKTRFFAVLDKFLGYICLLEHKKYFFRPSSSLPVKPEVAKMAYFEGFDAKLKL